MNISNKKLKKALEHYKNGDYDTALKICEKFLEKDYSNEEALSLEGDILYKLGRIDDAIVTWKINSEYNKNEEATNRLAAVDKERKAQALSYTNIQNMSSEDRILLENAYRENIELKKQVESSSLLNDGTESKESKNDESLDELNKNDSFEPVNDIPVNKEEAHTTDEKEYEVIETNIDELIENKDSEKNNKDVTSEDINLDEFKDRIKHLEVEELKEDRQAKEVEPTPVVESKKEESENDDDYSASFNDRPAATNQKKGNTKKKVIVSTIAVVAIIIVAISYSKMHSKSSKKDNSATINNTEQVKPSTDSASTAKPDASKDTATKPSTSTDSKVLTAEQAKQYTTDVDYLISQNSIDGIRKVLINTPKSEIPADIMSSYDKALNFMQTTGIEYYYSNGMDAYNSGDYATAVADFSQAQPFAEKDFRGPTMLFLSAVSYQKLDNYTLAVSTYKDFLKQYPDSENYLPETLYFLANYYSEHNSATQAKEYANELVTKFPNSMYNNDTLKKILK